MYVCLCHGISDKNIKKLAFEQGITDIQGIRRITPLGSQCGKCIRPAKELLNEISTSLLFKQAS